MLSNVSLLTIQFQTVHLSTLRPHNSALLLHVPISNANVTLIIYISIFTDYGRSTREGCILTRVCDSVHGGRGGREGYILSRFCVGEGGRQGRVCPVLGRRGRVGTLTPSLAVDRAVVILFTREVVGYILSRSCLGRGEKGYLNQVTLPPLARFGLEGEGRVP